MSYDRLPGAVSVHYAELLRHAIHPTPDGANLSFKTKTIGGRVYRYLHVSLGRRRSEHYLGPDSPELRARIARERALWSATEDDRRLRARLVAMLVSGGVAPVPAEEGKVLALLERGGVFLAGGVLVGTHAFRAYGPMLGVSWRSELRTRDIDIAGEARFEVALDVAREVDLETLLAESGMGFLAVPSLDRRAPATAFRIRGRELTVELLTPLVGKPRSGPVRVPSLDAWAEPVRFIDYLLEDVQLAVLPHAHGVLVNLPAPGRFALHKLVAAERRPAAFAVKARRDRAQAEMLIDALAEDRPGDLILAREAAEAMGGRFIAQLERGLTRVEPSVADRVNDIVGSR